MFRSVYIQLRPHLTVSRVAAAVIGLITVPAGLLIGKLSVALAGWGYSLDPTQTTVTFLGTATLVVAACVSAGLKWLDGRSNYEVAQVIEGNDPGSPPSA